MSKIFFIGNTESPYFGEIVQKIVLTGNDLIMNLDSYKQLLRLKLEKDFDYASIKTWSCDDNFSDYHVKSQIRGLFPFLYPDTIDRHAMKRLLNLSTQAHRGLGGFRLGFGVQEELFDLFLAHTCGANEIVYFDLLTSLQLLNPVNQLEYRKQSYEFLRFVNKEEMEISDQIMALRRYRIINSIPFYESFSARYDYPKLITHLVFE